MFLVTGSKINCFEVHSQSPDLNSIENLQKEVKIRVMARRPSSLEMELIAKDESSKITMEAWSEGKVRRDNFIHLLFYSGAANPLEDSKPETTKQDCIKTSAQHY
ncbi:hypothetical protein CHARACLAT_015536 [Characodon lateralis]|uniref:Uncharacterized protein n=1 Tax=Characodon lateralis TaxID=208331 RepID=A0ABU7E0S2_9TELE|nr:hypothetical protein [Characodon lateralis]